MNREEIEKSYKFALYLTSSKDLASRVIPLMADRYELVSMDLSDQCLYKDVWSFVESLTSQNRDCEKLQAKAVSYLFYKVKMTTEQISETLNIGRSSVIALLNYERERIEPFLEKGDAHGH